MTSFTKCSGTSFTLRARLARTGEQAKDGLENYGCPRTTGAVCGGSSTERKVFDRFMSGIRDLAAYRISVAEAVSRSRGGGHCGKESATTAESQPNPTGIGTRGG